MKKSIAAITARAILGFLALGLFAGCAAVLNGPPPGLTEGPAGTGRVLIRLGPKAEGARTLMPTTADYEALSYTYTFTSEGKDPVSGTLTEGTAAADLAAGIWTLTVEGKGGEDALSLKGTVTDIEVSAGTLTGVSVNMKGYTEAGAGNGTLSYTVTFPAAVSAGTLAVYRWDNNEEQGTPANLAAGPDTDDDDDTKTVSGTIDLPAGYYRVALDLYKADGILNRSDLAHIYPDLTTEAPYTIAAGDFAPATVDSAQTSLAGVLGSVSGLASGANVTYVLPIGDETMSAAASVSNTGPVTVTIDGGGREVTLDASGGSLITVGDKVTLVLKNITLKGRGEDYDNTAALVSVGSGGTLVMEDGSKISDNINFSSASLSYSSYGGGVYVGSSGTFTMSGGTVSGNTASESSSYYSHHSYGGGVYVGGTFTKSGGGTIYGSDPEATLRNTAASGDNYGHAVFVIISYLDKKLNTTAGPGVDLNSGWEDISSPPSPSTVTGITYDDVWALQEDGRRKSPAIGNDSVTKARVSFTAADNVFIVIQLDVSSHSSLSGYAFISELDNGSATGSSGYYTGSPIYGTQSVTVTIPVPTAGSHFVDIAYWKGYGGSSGSDCAWFKVVE